MLSWLLSAEAARRAYSQSLVREQFELLNCRGAHCLARFTHRPCLSQAKEHGAARPRLSRGKCPPEDASPALGACFLTHQKFFLFKSLTFSRLSVSSSAFVQQVCAVSGGDAERSCQGEPKWLRTGSRPGFSLEPGQGWGARGRQQRASRTWGCLLLLGSWYFCAGVTPSDQIVRADGCRWMGFGWRTSSLSLRSCQFSQLYISPLCQPLFSSPLSLSPPCAIF